MTSWVLLLLKNGSSWNFGKVADVTRLGVMRAGRAVSGCGLRRAASIDTAVLVSNNNKLLSPQ
ncbi:MAG TPA: hypothetical protein VJO52_09865 [Gemmatimonadaceae bacterium]|nr:hypothetical protein [Gemmatimonadaceae bacterium]